MQEFRAVKLKLKGPVTEVPHADTLFGAIANALAILNGSEAVDELVEAFRGGARISSTFPYSGDVYYLPKPLTVELMEFEDTERTKRMKRARYLDVENFERALRLETFDVPTEMPYRERSIPRVSLDRVTEKSALYFWDEIRFQEDSGLYFLYLGPEDVFNEFIKPAVRLLGDTGLGGKPTWGFGIFEPSFASIKIRTPSSPYVITLSNMLPTKTPLLWRILRKAGWSSGKRKPKMNFVVEGSVMKNDPGRIESLDLGLPFSIYVYGLAFPVPTLIPEGLE